VATLAGSALLEPAVQAPDFASTVAVSLPAATVFVVPTDVVAFAVSARTKSSALRASAYPKGVLDPTLVADLEINPKEAAAVPSMVPLRP
jgi:hypothetical protein